ncbi:MAG: helix-turn-helix domain-containing protein [Candidatus Rokubacteria bacterium]|nr:helix-turn-helix domain-containing protein [Candidatus Rokubacteria bacterium]
METASTRLVIGALSRRTGCNIETIRYYERTRLLPTPARSSGGYRLYGTEHLKRLIFIRRARALGFSIHEVRKLLELAEHRRRPCAEARSLAATHLEDVRAKIADLRVMERVLKETVARCGEGTGRHCPLIDALYRDGTARSDDTRGLRLSGEALEPRRTSQRRRT